MVVFVALWNAWHYSLRDRPCRRWSVTAVVLLLAAHAALPLPIVGARIPPQAAAAVAHYVGYTSKAAGAVLIVGLVCDVGSSFSAAALAIGAWCDATWGRAEREGEPPNGRLVCCCVPFVSRTPDARGGSLWIRRPADPTYGTLTPGVTPRATPRSTAMPLTPGRMTPRTARAALPFD
eukprot:gene31485-9037_t